jgi:class 3 adenylate cyclase
MRSLFERHGGRVQKFVGDAVVAVFGIPVVNEDDACGRSGPRPASATASASSTPSWPATGA